MFLSFWRSHVAWLLLAFVWSLWFPIDTLAQNPASYKGIQKDDFMKRWLVLGAIPITSGSKPDEEFQKKAFEKDWLVPHGGETGIVPSLNGELTISGKPYRWQAVESNADTVSLENLFSKPNYVVAYAASEIDMPEAASVILALGSDDGVRVWLNGDQGARSLGTARRRDGCRPGSTPAQERSKPAPTEDTERGGWLGIHL